MNINTNNFEVNSPDQALQKLKQGNDSYLNSKNNSSDISASLRENTAKNGQEPYAVIVTCSDSRVPPEHIFSAGVGELFVIRTAGNVVDDFALGSIEYGVKHLGAKIILVMGHSQCGAVSAAIAGQAEGYINTILEEIKPGIRGVTDAAEAEKLNIANSSKKIMESDIVKELVEKGSLAIVQARYELHSGKVTFF